jgi:hypothetical protein
MKLTLGTPVTIKTAGGQQWRGVYIRANGPYLTTVHVTGAPAHSAHVVNQRRDVLTKWVTAAPLFATEV